jgi:uncharacterized protein YndB with AHSA1/START domain
MNAMTDISLTTRRTIAAPAIKLYNAWLDPATVARFMTACEGQLATEVEIDARVGGSFMVRMPTPDGEVPHSGEYLDLVPGRKIAFTWNSKHVNPGTHVTITFEEKEGKTEMVLTHVKFENESKRDGHMKGWNMILDNFSREAA